MQKSSFKPLIASSLALALGFSVAVATDPTFSLDGEVVNSSVFGIQWTNNGNNSFIPQASDNTSLVGKKIVLVFNSDATNAGAVNGDAYDIKASNEVTNFTLTSTTTLTATSIELRPSKVSSVTGKITTLDLSGVTSGYALVGDFKTGGGSGNTNIGKFGGEGISGSVTLDGSASTEMYFTGNAGKITGALSITQNSTNIISFESGGSIGSFTASKGNSTINKLTYINSNSGTSTSNVVTISGGTNVLNFLDNGVITGNVSLTGGTTTMTNLATINGNIKASGNATLYLSNTEVGNISFDNQTGYNHTTSIFGVKSANSITTTGDWGYKITKKMKIVFADNASVKGKIWSKNEAITELVFSQATSATLKGSDDSAIDMEASQKNIAYGNYSKNVLVFGANTTAKIGTMSTSGDWSGNSSIATFNLLSFNDDTASTTKVTINAISSGLGRNIIGKNLATYNSSNSSVVYSNALFENGAYKQKTFSNPVAEFVKSTYSANGDFALGTDNTSNAISTGQGGANYININGSTTIKGKILSSVRDTQNRIEGHNNLIVLTGTSATLGEDGNAISIKVDNGGTNNYRNSLNTLLLGATQNTLNLSELSAIGSLNATTGQNFNALSINSGTTTATIASVNAGFGTNIIGKDLITQGDSDGNGSGYNTALFGNANTPSIQGGFVAEFVKSTYSVNGNFIFGDNSGISITDAISTGEKGLNYININGTTTIKGNISISVSNPLGPTSGHNNLLVLTGTSTTLGESGKEISIKVDNTSSNYGTNSNNTLLLGADSNTLNLSALSANGTTFSNATQNFNALSFNSTSGNGTKTLGAVSASYGSNIIGANLITQNGGYNASIIDSATIKRNNIASTFMSDAHTAKGTYNITSLTIENIVMGGNYINVENLTITDGVKADSTNTETGNDRFVENYIYTGNSGVIEGGVSVSRSGTVDTKNVITFAGSGTNSISGEISATGGSNNISLANNLTTTDNITKSGNGANYFTFIGNGTLTLQGETNQISTLTAYAPSTRSTSTSTLVIDGTTQANNTTIDSVINGGNLVVNFNGKGETKGATLKISSLTGNTLKSITLGEDSTNNTLDLTALGNTTISEAISVGERQELNINLTNTALTTNGWSNAGTSVINVNGSATANSTLKGGNVELTSLNLNATTSTSMTLQNANTTINTLTSGTATNGNTLALNSSLGNAVNATIESQVDGGNLTLVFNGGEDRSTSLTLNSGDNTFKALSLGSNQSTHNTLNLNSGKTTIEGNISVGNSATQALAFTLKNSTELSLTNGLTTGSNGFTTLRVEDATNGATLSGNGTITLTNLDMVSNSNSSLTFKNTTTTIDTLTSNATDTQINTLIMGDGSSNVTLNDTAKGTKFNLTYNDGTTNGAKTFTLTGGENTIKQVLVDSNDTGTNNTLAVSGGSTTIDTINASGRNLTLALSSDASSPSDTLVTINNAISGTNVSFSGGVNPADQVHFSTLLLKGASNTISSVTTNATNAKIVMKDTAQAEITTLSFDSSNGGSLLFGFEGTGNSTITLGDGSSAITIGDKQTLGISIGGSGTREIKVVGKDSSNITFNSGSTLVVDFQETKAGDNITATLGNGSGFTIEDGSNSIINLRGGAGTSSLSGGVTLDGGNNTVNFIGNAKLSNINLKSGTNTINVYEGITGIVDVATTDENNRVSNVTNIINLKDNSTLQLVDGDTQNASLTSSADDKTNTLNFLGDNATLQGGFGANDGGTATINVGDTNNANTSVNGAITGNVSNAGVTFQTNNSTLTLQGANNTFTTATSNVENAKILMKDTAGAEITSINLNTSGSLIFGFEGTGDSTITLGNGTDAINIASGQTLGISIGGSGTRNLQVIGKNGAGESKSNITFADGSTLLIDFQRTQKGDNITATLGSGGQSFTISGTSKSIINLRGGEGTSQLNGSITLNGGTNTINFLDTATMGDVITLTSGTNIINVSGADSVAQAITGTMAISRVGGVNNTINLGDYSTLKLTDGSEGVGELKTTATNTLNFLGDGATLQGGFGAGTSEDPAQTGTATINVGDSNHSTQVVNGVITGNVTSADVTFKANNSTLTLQGATNTLNALSSTDSTITGTIILDAQTSAGVNATITSAVANNSSVGLKFGAGGNAKTFTFSASGNHLSGVEFDESGSTNNTLSFTSTGNSITSPFEIANNQELIIDLQNSSDLSIAGLSSSGGEANLQSTGTATLKGGEVSVNTLSLLDSTSNALTLQNSSTAIQFLNASGSTSNTLKLDASSQDVYAEIGAITQGNLTASFNGGTHQATLKIVGSGNTLSDLTLGTSSTNNTLSLANGATTISSASGVSVSSNQGITFDLADSTELNLQALSNAGAMSATLANGSSLNITGAFSNTAGTSNITLADNSSLNTTGIVNSGGSTTLILNGTSSITGDITSSDSATTAITLGESAVGKITGDIAFNGTSTANWTFADNSSLTLEGSLDNATSTATTIALEDNSSLNISKNFSNSNGELNLTLADSSSLAFTTLSNQGTATLALNGASSVAGDISTTAGSMAITFGANGSITGDISTSGSGISTAISLNDGANATITGSINNSNDATTTLTYSTGNATLTLKGGTQEISTLNLSANNSTSILNLANSTTTIGNPTLTLDSSKNLNVNIDSTSSLTLASVSTSSGAFNASGDGSLTATNITSSSTSGSNTINVGTLTLSGNLTAQQGSTNSITANTATFSGEISANNNNASSRNLITINESVTFNTNASIKADSNNNNTGNIFKLNGAVNGTITEVTSKQVNTKNILSFDGTTANTLTINDINKTDTLSSNASGYVYIGKNLTSGSGSSLALASGVNNNWNSSDYTANLNLKVTNNIYSKSKGFNYINVASLEVGTTGQDNTGTITSDGATNNIATSGRFKANKITSESGGVMNVFIGGNGEIGSINAGGGSGSGNGTNTITFTGANTQSIVKGDITTTTAGTGTTKVNNLTLSGSNATLTLEGKDANGTTHAITTLNASGANTILVLDNSKVTSGAMSTTIGTLSNGANLTATLKGQGTDKEVTLALNGGTLKALTLGETSTGNILDLSNATSMSITNQVNVGNGQDLTIKLKNTTLALNGGLSTSGNGSKIELVGDDTNTSNATLTGRAVALSNLALSATTSNTLTISSSSAVIDSISASGTTSNTIALSGTRTTITSAINVNDTNNNNPLSFEVTNSTLVFGSSDNTITSLTSNGGLVDLSVGVKPAGQDISTQDAITGLTPALLTRGLVREGEESGVVTTPEAPVVTDPQAPSVDSQPSTTPSTNTGSKDARNTLTITSGFTGEATFKLYASSNTADRVVFTQASTLDAGDDADNSSNVTGKAIIALTGNSDIYNITFDENGSDNIMVADASGANGSVEVVGGESMIGTSTAIVNLVTIDEKTYIGDVVEGEINQSLQAIASSALAVNYDLYLANFNSLNKRMGELRDNDHNQGVWARVFGGNMSNSFGAGSKTDYLTAQAGYDYSLSVGENARNYMGIALAYGTSSTKSNTLGINAIGTPFESIALDRVDSNMVEVGLYNSYVADSGWYNDTILKFDYIMSEFSLSNDTSVMSKTNNFAMVLSDEFGYRYSFAENEKGSWYIDPQVEVAFGYFNQSDFNRAVLNNDKVPANLNASQDAILTLRSRIGASLGKKFTTDKGFASLYVGASYEYDYIEGGQSEASTRSGGYITQLDKVESNGRAVLNVGSNIELTKGARLYIDVEKSFGDKQRTFMQFNLGARYSF